MTRKLFHYGLIILVLVTATAAFSVMRSLNQGRPRDAGGAGEWLSLSHNQCRQIDQADPGFKEQAQTLSEQLRAHQQGLITLIREAGSDESIRRQALLVVDAHHRLMRRVVQRLLTVRRYADTQQGLRLQGLCSGIMAGGPQGQGDPPLRLQQQEGQGMHGPGYGQGRGMGMGMRMRMGMGQQPCGRLAPALALTAAQQEDVARLDPSFEADVAPLTEGVRTLHGQLAQNLADTEATDTVVLSSLDDLIRARVLLEQRTAEHVLRIRPLLTVEQQERLIGLAQMGCGRCGGRLKE